MFWRDSLNLWHYKIKIYFTLKVPKAPLPIKLSSIPSVLISSYVEVLGSNWSCLEWVSDHSPWAKEPTDCWSQRNLFPSLLSSYKIDALFSLYFWLFSFKFKWSGLHLWSFLNDFNVWEVYNFRIIRAKSIFKCGRSPLIHYQWEAFIFSFTSCC